MRVVYEVCVRFSTTSRAVISSLVGNPSLTQAEFLRLNPSAQTHTEAVVLDPPVHTKFSLGPVQSLRQPPCPLSSHFSGRMRVPSPHLATHFPEPGLYSVPFAHTQIVGCVEFPPEQEKNSFTPMQSDLHPPKLPSSQVSVPTFFPSPQLD
jgi:hypothetical protein